MAEGIFESTVTITVTAKVKDKVAFLVEGKQAGIFEARNIPAEQLDPLLGIGCPNIVYPYLRANIADVITRAGFPPVHLAEINFEVFYQQRLPGAGRSRSSRAAAAPAASGIVMPGRRRQRYPLSMAHETSPVLPGLPLRAACHHAGAGGPRRSISSRSARRRPSCTTRRPQAAASCSSRRAACRSK